MTEGDEGGEGDRRAIARGDVCGRALAERKHFEGTDVSQIATLPAANTGGTRKRSVIV